MRNLLSLSLLAAASAAFAVACGGEDDDTQTSDTTESADTSGDGSGNACVAPAPDPACTSPLFTEHTWRATNVTIRKPSGVGAVLAALINQDIRNDILHIGLRGQDPQCCGAGNVTVLGGGACLVGRDAGGKATLTWDPAGFDPGATSPNSATATIDAGNNVNSVEGLTLRFPALDPTTHTKLIIPIHDVRVVDGYIEPSTDGASVLLSGTLEGAVLADDCDVTITLAGQTKTICDLLGQGNKDYPSRDAAIGWAFQADFKTEEVNLDAAAACPEGSGNGSGE